MRKGHMRVREELIEKMYCTFSLVIPPKTFSLLILCGGIK